MQLSFGKKLGVENLVIVSALVVSDSFVKDVMIFNGSNDSVRKITVEP